MASIQGLVSAVVASNQHIEDNIPAGRNRCPDTKLLPAAEVVAAERESIHCDMDL